MKNYNDPKVQARIIAEFKEKWPDAFPMDIVVATYNRYAYLQKCIWSILASTKMPYKLIVGDDNSPENVKNWLYLMRKRKKIHGLIMNKANIGSAFNFNRLIDITKTPWFTMLGDDVWVYRGWEYASMDLILTFPDCGIASFYNFSNVRYDKGYKKINDFVIKGGCTGLGCSIMSKELWTKAGKFYMPHGKKMGFFTSKFCKKAFNLKNITRKHLYMPIPHYGENMDRMDCKLEEINDTIQTGYIYHRVMNKYGLTMEQAKARVSKGKYIDGIKK